MDISTLYSIFLTCRGVTTDSRNCPEGAMFFALKGDSFNGNAFAGQALEKGCACAVIDEASYAVSGDSRYITVEDVLTALQQLACYHRQQFDIEVIGITGTNGKTTTKELIAAVLSKLYNNVLYTEGNQNNHIGVPLTLLRLTRKHDIAVIEMGANHPGEIKTLVEIVKPNFGIITNVGKAHLEGFGSFEGVMKAKGELYDYIRRENGHIFIDHDNPYLMEMAKGSNRIFYGTEGDLYIYGHITGNSPYLAMEWKEGKEGKWYNVETQLIGEYNFSNVLAAVTIGCHLGVWPMLINRAINEYIPQNNRSQLKQTEDNVLVVDTYNANPASMMAALKNFKSMIARDKMLILGDMLELGDGSAAEHQKIIDFIDGCTFDNVALVGGQFAATRHHYTSYRNVQELIKAIEQNKPKGKTILIKGSNGIKLIQAVEYL